MRPAILKYQLLKLKTMKTIYREKTSKGDKAILLVIASVMLLIMATLLLQSCGSKDPAPSAKDQVKAKLTSATWKLQSVTVDGTDKTSIYAGLTMKFSDATFTTTNGDPVWLPSDTWTFSSDDGKTITRGDGLPITVEVTDTTLKLSLMWSKTTYDGGRVSSIKGQHVFTLTK